MAEVVLEAFARLEDAVETRLARMEEKQAAYGEAIHEISRKIDDLIKAVYHIEQESKVAQHIQQTHINSILDIGNRITIWGDRFGQIEKRVETLENERKRDLEEKKEDVITRDKIIGRWQWAAGFFVTTIVALLGIILWFITNLDFKPQG